MSQENYEFFWPISALSNNTPYTADDIAAWKRRHLDGSEYFSRVYERLSSNPKPSKFHSGLYLIKVCSPLLMLAVLSIFVDLLPVVLLSCVVVPCQIVVWVMVASKIVCGMAIQALINMERKL